ncbi:MULTISPECIES: ArsR/SmtB family transcription factor [Actinokineospora]|uniref:Transcriptional regulator n=1 Tax=Actinokineospora fastidiosa TaxID=1816 RepID=A0A918L703_9PSEU|nr:MULTISPECIES: metalloregulator ArsR/SmtB family transcription factor [Actinokineospora]UVS76826.1 HTH-type transcriptional regulator KmtR [Actinokineospora sp. UTMC 2448]GGS15522.1 transcriptional regulator [Actinokineospora fastidiosa]
MHSASRDHHARTGEPTDDQVDTAVGVFAMLSDATRLRILWALRDGGERDVTTLADLAGVGPTSASQHLTKLRLAGLVATRKEGRRVFYRARGSHLRRLLDEALFRADHETSGLPDDD